MHILPASIILRANGNGLVGSGSSIAIGSGDNPVWGFGAGVPSVGIWCAKSYYDDEALVGIPAVLWDVMFSCFMYSPWISILSSSVAVFSVVFLSFV